MNTQHNGGIEEFAEFGRQLEAFSNGPLTSLAEFAGTLESINSRLGNGAHVAKVAKLAHSFRCDSNALAEETAFLITNVHVVSSRLMDVIKTIDELKAAFETIRAEAK